MSGSKANQETKTKVQNIKISMRHEPSSSMFKRKFAKFECFFLSFFTSGWNLNTEIQRSDSQCPHVFYLFQGNNHTHQNKNTHCMHRIALHVFLDLPLSICLLHLYIFAHISHCFMFPFITPNKKIILDFFLWSWVVNFNLLIMQTCSSDLIAW